MMKKPLATGRVVGNIDWHSRDAYSIYVPFSEIADLIVFRDLPSRIIRRRCDDLHFVAASNKVLTEFRIVFGHSNKVRSIVDSHQKNAHLSNPEEFT